MSGWGAWLSAAGVIAALAGLAAVDAKRLRISWVFLGLLIVAGTGWHMSGSESSAEALLQGLVGCAVGAAVAAGPIAWAKMKRGRTLLSEGDGLLLGAIGFLVGPLGLAWSMTLGGIAVLIHRGCLQRKRGRPFRRGNFAFAPGMAVGAACVFAALNVRALEAGLVWR